jgi:hypothetical protein
MAATSSSTINVFKIKINNNSIIIFFIIHLPHFFSSTLIKNPKIKINIRTSFFQIKMNGKKSPKIRLTTREDRKGAIFFTQKIDWKFLNIIIDLSPSSTFSTSNSYPSNPS